MPQGKRKRVIVSDAPDKIVSIKIIKPKKRPALSKKERMGYDTEALDRALKKMADSGYKLDSSLDFLQKSKPKKFRR